MFRQAIIHYEFMIKLQLVETLKLKYDFRKAVNFLLDI